MSYYIKFEKGPDFSANPVPSGATFNVAFTVKNTGDAPATASTDPFQQGINVAYQFTNGYGRSVEDGQLFVPTLAPGESSVQTLDTSFNSAETFTLTLTADPGNGQGDSIQATLQVV